MTDEEIKKKAENFWNNVILPMLPEDVICPVCAAANCSNNDHCINCDYKFKK